MNTAKPLLCVAFLLTASLLWGKEPDAFYYAKVKGASQTAFAQKLTSLPEWAVFQTLVCDAIDKAVNTGLTDRPNLERVLPPKLAAQIAEKVDARGFSIREALQALTEHLEAVVVIAEENDFQRFDGVVALIADVNPSFGVAWLPIIEGIQEGKDYKFLKKEIDGDFILQFDFESKQLNRNVKFGCAGLRLPGSGPRYALLFSNESGIQKYYDRFKKGETGEEYAKGWTKRLVVGERCFRALEAIGQKQAWPVPAMEFCRKTASFKIGCRDVTGVTQIEAALSLSQTNDARSVRETLQGTAMLVELALAGRADASAETKELARQISNFLQTVKAEADGNDVFVTMKLDGSDFWKLISAGLKKASDELLQNRADFPIREELRRRVRSIVFTPFALFYAGDSVCR